MIPNKMIDENNLTTIDIINRCANFLGTLINALTIKKYNDKETIKKKDNEITTNNKSNEIMVEWTK